MDGPLHIEPAPKFEKEVFDVTNYPECIGNILCGGMKRTLTFEAEELTVSTGNFCLQNTSRTPYANVDSLDVENVCCMWELPELASPGCGCDKAKVEEIAEKLNQRVNKRGDV